MKFSDLEFNPHSTWVGKQAIHSFPNGYGVSVIRAAGTPFGGSYGHELGLYELAVLKEGGLCYETHITDDVLGGQTEDQITEVMRQVEALPAD